MKKLLCILTLGALVLGCYGCSDEGGEQSAKSDDSASVNIDADRLTSDYDSLVKNFTPLLRSYYDGIRAADYDACFSAFPDFYRSAVDKECENSGLTHQEYIDFAKKAVAEECGDDFATTFTYANIFQLTDDSISAYEEILESCFDQKIELEDAYSVCINESTRGTLGSTTYELEWFVFQIDGTLYLYESYYEGV
ncbi:MAG: hypothetical protein E7501_02930 [Ruminococcus sp.]|nr:hypothetical protein [Ruminococcus sp.]